MEYIDKKSKDGIDLIEDYLKRLKAHNEPYPSDIYIAFDRKDILRNILVEEQGERCCYCMRRINKTYKTTLEHLIINNVKSLQDFEQYLSNKTILNSNVCYTKDFIDNQIEVVPPYPHTISYHNLVASCNGQIGNKVVCCNHKRGSKFIEPLVLYNNIKTRVSYKRNGYADLEGDVYPSIIEVLGLNNIILRIIRAILIYAKDNRIDILNCSREELINGAICRVNIDNGEDRLVYNFKKDVYWNLLGEYDYFLHNPNIQP